MKVVPNGSWVMCPVKLNGAPVVERGKEATSERCTYSIRKEEESEGLGGGGKRMLSSQCLLVLYSSSWEALLS